MAAEQDTIEQLSDSEIFNQAMAKDEPAKEQTQNEPETPTEAPTEAKAERARDSQGRFAPATTDQPQEVVTDAGPEPVVEDKGGHQIPSWRLAEEAQAKREALERLQQEQRQREALQQQLWQLQQEMQARQTPEPEIDIFADPDAYKASLRQEMVNWQRQQQGEMSLTLAGIRHGDDTIKQAFGALQERVSQGDLAPWQQVVNDRNPGEALVNWFKQSETLKLVGNDPAAYTQKVRDEALNDPEFLAKAMEKFKGVAAAQPTQQIKIPASINKATGMGLHDSEDYSDEAIFKQAMRR